MGVRGGRRSREELRGIHVREPWQHPSGRTAPAAAPSWSSAQPGAAGPTLIRPQLDIAVVAAGRSDGRASSGLDRSFRDGWKRWMDAAGEVCGLDPVRPGLNPGVADESRLARSASFGSLGFATARCSRSWLGQLRVPVLDRAVRRKSRVSASIATGVPVREPWCCAR